MQSLRKMLYGFAFIVVLPIILYCWSRYTDDVVVLPLAVPPVVSWMCFLLGLVVFLLSLVTLTKYGEGLPMNAFPPSKFVTSGLYKIFSHPIYLGFCFMVYGLAAIFVSHSGFYLVAPSLALGCIALVMGYENPDMTTRFQALHYQPFVGLIEDGKQVPDAWDKVKSVLSLFVYALFFIGLSFSWSNGYLDSFSSLFLLVCGVVIGLTYVNTTTFPELSRNGLQILVFLIATTLSSAILRRNVGLTGLLCLSLFLNVRNFSIAVLCSTIIVVVSIVLGWLDVRILPFEGINLLLALASPTILLFLKSWSETKANSWKSWQIGQMRIINHGLYVGAAAFIGVKLANVLTGGSIQWEISSSVFFGLVGAGLWGQMLEGSGKLKRPFGYFGSLVGCMVAGVLCYFLKSDMWLLFGALAVSFAFAQGLGRIRCLINGCCHGRVTEPSIGIMVENPQSRVTKISSLQGKPIHITQMYSLAWLLLVGVVLLILWINSVTLSIIIGLYFILSGIGRFVEESYRGEIQTTIIGGLRIYQWLSVLLVFIGIAVSCFSSPSSPGLRLLAWNWSDSFSAFVLGILFLFAFGIDFPQSDKPFSRL